MRYVLPLVLLTGCSATTSTPVAFVDPMEPTPVVVQEKVEAPPTFPLPADDVGKLLGKALPPERRPGGLAGTDKATPRQAPLPPLDLTPPPPPAPTIVVRMPIRVGGAARPAGRIEEQLDLIVVGVPREPSFLTPPLVRVDSVDPALPAMLPVTVSMPVGERIGFDDPTTDVSTAAVLAAPLPSRAEPLPFARQAVPEPFEHRAGAGARPSEEPAVIELARPPLPKR